MYILWERDAEKKEMTYKEEKGNSGMNELRKALRIFYLYEEMSNFYFGEVFALVNFCAKDRRR